MRQKYLILLLLGLFAVNSAFAQQEEVVLARDTAFCRFNGNHPNQDVVLPAITSLLDKQNIQSAEKLVFRIFGDVSALDGKKSPAEVIVQFSINTNNLNFHKITYRTIGSDQGGKNAILAIELTLYGVEKIENHWIAKSLSIEAINSIPDGKLYIDGESLNEKVWRTQATDFLQFENSIQINGYGRTNTINATTRLGYEISAIAPVTQKR